MRLLRILSLPLLAVLIGPTGCRSYEYARPDPDPYVIIVDGKPLIIERNPSPRPAVNPTAGKRAWEGHYLPDYPWQD